MKKILKDTLCSLRDSGKHGFEGLMATLLSSITGASFLLAKSGSQGGRDIQNDTTYIECKQYCKDKEPKFLLEKVAQAHQNNQYLDLWLLVTMTDISAQANEAIEKHCNELGIAYCDLFARDSQRYLQALCILERDAFITFLETTARFKKDKPNISSLKKYLFRSNPQDYLSERGKTLKTFQLAEIGYSQFKESTNTFYKKALTSNNKAMACFGQKLNIHDNGTTFIERKSATQALNKWLSIWKNTRQVMVIHGEEGNGKSWVVANWLSTIINKKSPIVIFKNASDCETNDIDDLLLNNIKKLSSSNKPDSFWDRKRATWFGGNFEQPRMILVLDGINERYDNNWWRKLIHHVATNYSTSIAFIITVRTSYWQEHFDNDRYFNIVKFEVEGFNDNELNQSLSCIQKKREDFPASVLPMLRKPRYFYLVSKLLPELRDDSRSITVERLCYEDIKKRWENKQYKAYSPQQFEELILTLAEKQIDQGKGLPISEIKNELPEANQVSEALIELQTSNILEKKSRLYKLPSQQLAVGLALLLCEEIDTSIKPDDDFELVRERISGWLEPKTGADFQAKVVGAAAIIALSRKSYSHQLKVGLFYEWIISHNRQNSDRENFYTNFHLAPKVYSDVIEVVCRNKLLNDENFNLIVFAMIRHIDSDIVKKELAEIIIQWFSFIHPKGFPDHRTKGRPNLEDTISERVAFIKKNRQLVAKENLSFNFQEIIIESDQLLSLRKVALSVISYSSRQVFIQSLVQASISNFIMYEYSYCSDEFSWVIRSSKDDISDALLKKGKELINSNALCLKRAGYSLLVQLGSDDAVKLVDSMPEKTFPNQDPSGWMAEQRKKPCESPFSWKKEQAIECLNSKKITIPIHLLIHKIDKFIVDPNFFIPEKYYQPLSEHLSQTEINRLWHDYMQSIEHGNLEDLEHIALRTSPLELQILYRQLLAQLNDRTKMAFRQLAIHINYFYLLLENSDLETINSAWQRVSARFSGCTEKQLNNLKFMEHRLFSLLLSKADTVEAISLIDRRNSKACAAFDDECYFNFQSQETIPILSLSDSNTVTISKLRLLQVIQKIHAKDIAILPQLLPIQDSHIQYYVLKLLHTLKIQPTIHEFIHSGWKYIDHVSKGCNNGHYGSLILAEYGLELKFDELMQRISLSHVGYAIKKRGSKVEELSSYIHAITKMLSILRKQGNDLEVLHDISFSFDENSHIENTIHFSLPRYLFQHDQFPSEYSQQKTHYPVGYLFDDYSGQKQAEVSKYYSDILKKQIEDSNHWLVSSFNPASLDDVIKHDSDKAKQWVELLIKDNTKLHLGRSFASALCASLLKTNLSELGLRLYKTLYNKNRGINFYRSAWLKVNDYDIALFQADINRNIESTLKERLMLCTTDLELMSLCVGLQFYKKTDWLLIFCETLLDSKIASEVALGLTLLGFHDSVKALNALNAFVNDNQNSWLTKVAKASINFYETIQYPKHWFSQFIYEKDSAKAWAAFRLFTKSVNFHYILWKGEKLNDMKNHPWFKERYNFLIMNRNDIKRGRDKNTKKLKETLLHQKISNTNLSPWLFHEVFE